MSSSGPSGLGALRRLRDDASVHWTAEKRRLSIESDPGEMFPDSRVNVFLAKEVLPQSGKAK